MFIESIQTGAERTIGGSDIQEVLSAAKPSVSPQELARYEQWQTT